MPIREWQAADYAANFRRGLAVCSNGNVALTYYTSRATKPQAR